MGALDDLDGRSGDTVLICFGCAETFRRTAESPSLPGSCPRCGGRLDRPREPGTVVSDEPNADARAPAAPPSRGTGPPPPVALRRVPAGPPGAAQPRQPAADAPAHNYPPTPPGASPATTPWQDGERTPAPDAGEPVGTPFGRRYILVRELGRGGMGVVFSAWDRQLRRIVALKTLLPELAPTPTKLDRFLREARAAAGLRHPGIVSVLDIDKVEEDGVETCYFFTMEYVQGEALDQAGPKLSTRRFVETLRQAALALAAAHEAGIIHRDVKPGNLLVDTAGKAFLTDFGLAKKLKEARPQGLTAANAVLGTPYYMSPEQAQGRIEALGPSTDIWSLGIMLYEHFVGRTPFEGPSYVEILKDIVDKDVEPPTRATRRTGTGRPVPAELETITMKCLEKDPAHRYASAAQLAADLGRFLEGEPIQARAPSAAYRLRKWVVKKRLLVASAATCALSVAVAGVSVWRERAADREKARERAGRAEAELEHLRRSYQLAESKFAQGREHRRGMKLRQAIQDEDEALAAEPAHLGALYERTVLAAQACQERVRALRDRALAETLFPLVPNVAPADPGALARSLAAFAEQRGRSDSELVRRRAEATAFLARLATRCEATHADPAPDRRPFDAHLLAARGLILACGESGAPPGEARDLLEKAILADATLDEAYEGLAWIAEVEDRQGEALAAYVRGLQKDRAYLPFLIGQATAFKNLGVEGLRRQEDPTRSWDSAGRNLGNEKKAAEGWTTYRVARADIHKWWGLYKALTFDTRGSGRGKGEGGTGGKPTNQWSLGIAEATEAIRCEPGTADTWLLRAQISLLMSQHDKGRTGGPEVDLSSVLEDASEALKLEPGLPLALRVRAAARVRLATFLRKRGGNALVQEEQAAIEALSGLLDVTPAAADAHVARGVLNGQRGEWATAVSDLEEGVRLDPSLANLCDSTLKEARSRAPAGPTQPPAGGAPSGK